MLGLVAASAAAGAFLVYWTSYWLAVRDPFGVQGGFTGWFIYLLMVFAAPMFVVDTWGQAGVWWGALFAPTALVVVQQILGRRFPWCARWSLRPALRMAIRNRLITMRKQKSSSTFGQANDSEPGNPSTCEREDQEPEIIN